MAKKVLVSRRIGVNINRTVSFLSITLVYSKVILRSTGVNLRRTESGSKSNVIKNSTGA